MSALGRLDPQRELLVLGIIVLALVPLGLTWTWLDARTVVGEPVGLKPTKFAISIAVYLLTAVWMMSYVRPDRIMSVPVRTTAGAMIAGCAIELGLILLQAARARQSHFNTATPLDAAIYAVMGLSAVLFIGAVLPLAVEIAARPRADSPPIMIWSIVTGLALTFLLGAGTGAAMSAASAHATRLVRTRLPLLGWAVDGSDLRVPHFLGVHAMQIVPALGLAASLLRPREGAIAWGAGVIAFVATTIALVVYAFSLRSDRVTAHSEAL